MVMPGRSFASGTGYRYGFNGQEKVDEVNGSGNHNTAEFWEYDTRLTRRWNLDPIIKEWESPYSTFAENPILYMDANGLDWYKNEAGAVFWQKGNSANVTFNNEEYSNIGETYTSTSFNNGSVMNISYNQNEIVAFSTTELQSSNSNYFCHGTPSNSDIFNQYYAGVNFDNGQLLPAQNPNIFGRILFNKFRIDENGVLIDNTGYEASWKDKYLYQNVESDINSLQWIEGRPVSPYQVGRANYLKRNSLVGDRLEVHHVGQSHVYNQIIKDYDKRNGPAIILPRYEHQILQTLKGPINVHPRSQLAKDIYDLRRKTNAPSSSLLDLIELNRTLYPQEFIKNK